jgi:replication factor C subunit 1
MFTTKYRPTDLNDFIGNQKLQQPFIEWLLKWDPMNKKKKCALISGLSGTGKSLFIELVLKKHCCNAVHLTPDDDRSKESIQHSIKPLLHTKKSFDDMDNVLVVSDIDGPSGDYGFISVLVECIKEADIPIVCICDDRFSQNIKSILSYCIDFKMLKPTYQEIYALVYKVVTQEKIKIGKSNVDRLIEESKGDIRFILNTLQMGVKKGDAKKHCQSSNIFDTTSKLFNMESEFKDKYATYWLAHDIHPLMVHENYIGCIMGGRDPVKCVENLVTSSAALSDMDLLDTEFNFDLEQYIASNAIRSTLKCNKKGQIKFPQFLGKTSLMNKNKREKMDYNTVKFKGV